MQDPLIAPVLPQKADGSWYAWVDTMCLPSGRYLSVVHSRDSKDEVRQAIEWVARTYGCANEFYRNNEHTKIAVTVHGRIFTLEFDQGPIKEFLNSSPELSYHGNFVTTIKVPRSGDGKFIACAAGFFALVKDTMTLAFTSNEPWHWARIKFVKTHWRQREYNAVKISDRMHLMQYLNIPKSICAQIINAYDKKSFVEVGEAKRWLLPYKAVLISRERADCLNGEK